MGIWAILFGCNNDSNYKNTFPSVKLEPIITDTTDSFCDIFLKITSETKIANKHIYIAKGLYKNITVGLQFEIISQLPYGITNEGEVNTKDGFIHEGIWLVSIGQETDNFLRAISELYKIPTSKTFSRNKIPATIFSLNKVNTDLNNLGYYKFKVFFNENEDENSYAEIYINIDTEKKVIEFHEKDQEYRKPLVNTFTH